MTIINYLSDGLCGLSNLGNTCFMNSCLQILCHTYELHGEINKLKTMKYDKLFIEFVNLLNMLWKTNSTIKPNNFHNAFQKKAIERKNENFIGYNQNDASEFIIFLFDEFHSICKVNVDMKIKGTVVNDVDSIAVKCYNKFIETYKNDYSLFIKLFYHMSIHTNISLKDNSTISQVYQPNFILDLPIPNITECSLHDCLELYYQNTFLLNDNALYDEKSKTKHNVVQKLSIWNLPTIMIICLKRFSYTGKKNQNLVKFPLKKLKLDKYVIGYDKSAVYDLYGICNHSGCTFGGHYTSFIKTNKNKWYLCNDTIVTEIPEDKLEHHIITNKAYCLFYRKVDS
jgi:ubiquitin C-terminal hydrolase